MRVTVDGGRPGPVSSSTAGPAADTFVEAWRTDHGHGVQDHLDAVERARRGYRREWDPILAAEETEPGLWQMVGAYGRIYAIIRLLEIAGERGYRVTTWADCPGDRTLAGYFRTLRAAPRAGHMAFVRSHGQNGAANGLA